MGKIKILWIDDEIDLLKPHILFLEDKGYEVISINNGSDAMNIVKSENLDIVFLDEQMPGLSGIETLSMIKSIAPALPIVMITKSEEEEIMEQAIGSKISDYLIKPINPHQILSTLKKHLESKRLRDEKNTSEYLQAFREISMNLSANLSFEEWEEMYKKLVYWDLELSKNEDEGIQEILENQKEESNLLFSKYVEKNYLNFLKGNVDHNMCMSHTVLRHKMFPLMTDDTPMFLLLIDNLRYDHWKIIQPLIEQHLRVVSDQMYMSILPSVTQYARNSLFAGLLPSEIEKKYPQLWVNEDEDDHKNQYEQDLLSEYLRRHGKDPKMTFNKVFNHSYGKKMVESIPQMMDYKFNVIVYNFVDMLSHASTDVDLVREMSSGENAYRSLVLSWFEHSPLLEFIKQIATKKVKVVITTDHGSVRITNPVRVKGDRETSTNLRYKSGRKLDYNPKEVFEIKNPGDAFLPRINLSSSFIFCRNRDYFVYPNNYNQYVHYYKNTIQHGGISLDEMMIPFIILQSK